jgi:hypothetical protein
MLLRGSDPKESVPWSGGFFFSHTLVDNRRFPTHP